MNTSDNSDNRQVEFTDYEEARAAAQESDDLYAVYTLDRELVRYEINVPARVLLTDSGHWYSGPLAL